MSRGQLYAGLQSFAAKSMLGSVAQAAEGFIAIDTHAHVFKRDLALAGNRRYAPAYDATIADFLAMLDRNGMSHGVLIQPSFLGTDNSYLLEALRTAPERLRGIVVVAPEIGKRELGMLSAAGCVGVRLNLIGRADPAFHTAVWRTHLAELAALGWQVEVQAEAHRLPTLLPPLVAAGVPVVVDHFGRPDLHLGIDDPGFRYLLSAGPSGRVWVKLSGAYRNGDNGLGGRTVAAATLLRETFGPDRLVWGSDWPHTQFEAVASPVAARQSLDIWLPNPSERNAVLGNTPAHLFGFQTASTAEP